MFLFIHSMAIIAVTVTVAFSLGSDRNIMNYVQTGSESQGVGNKNKFHSPSIYWLNYHLLTHSQDSTSFDPGEERVVIEIICGHNYKGNILIKQRNMLLMP